MLSNGADLSVNVLPEIAGAGELTCFAHFFTLVVIEETPERLSPFLNVLKTLDGVTWALVGAAALSVAAVLHLQTRGTPDRLTPLDSLLLVLGLVFQEFSLTSSRGFAAQSARHGPGAAATMLLWVAASTLLAMGLHGNLKASFIQAEYEPPTLRLRDALADPSATAHMTRNTYDYTRSFTNDPFLRIWADRTRATGTIFPTDG